MVDQLQTVPEWLSYIEGMHHKEIDLGLSRVERVADQLALVKFDATVVTIGGTNGKGSCVATLNSIYSLAGYRVATYTSPHIQRFNERIRIANRLVDDHELLQAFSTIEQTRVELSISLSFFEFVTLAALWLFKQWQPDIILLEVGLGGRLDAVNIVENDIAIITSIALDHMNWLGETRGKIAAEKAGIARQNKPLISGDVFPPQSLKAIVDKLGACLYQAQQDFHYQENGQVLSWSCGDTVYEVVVPYQIKLQNVATALMCVELLRPKHHVSCKQIINGVAKTYISGRFEQVSEKPCIILDVAHNPAATEWLKKQLLNRYDGQRIIAVFGAMQDKQIDEILMPLIDHISAWYLTDLPMERAEKADKLGEIISVQGGKKWYTFPSVADALSNALDAATLSDCILIFGSFFTVSGANEWLEKQGVLTWS